MWVQARRILGANLVTALRATETLGGAATSTAAAGTSSRAFANASAWSTNQQAPEIGAQLLDLDTREPIEPRRGLLPRLQGSPLPLPVQVQGRFEDLFIVARTDSSSSDSSSGQSSVSDDSSDAGSILGEGLPEAAASASSSGRMPGLFIDEQYAVGLFQRCKPSVVHIASLGAAADVGYSRLPLDPSRQPRIGFGSGFVWDDGGHVVTNYHVIRNASSVQVTLAHSSKRYTAHVRGVEPNKDLAVLHIDAPAEELHPLQLGSSSRLLVGQKVFSIGNPFGLDHTLTAGIVSGLGREMGSFSGHTIRDVIQTDAAINSGNSGGPLLDSLGRLVGVSTAAFSHHPPTTAGLGFAIPSDTVRRIVNQIIRHGRVARPGLGINCMPDNQARAMLRGDPGVVIFGVIARSGADQAGLRGVTLDACDNVVLGDVIVAVGRLPVNRVEDLLACVDQYNVRDEVPLTIHRYEGASHDDRRYITLEVAAPLLSDMW